MDNIVASGDGAETAPKQPVITQWGIAWVA